VNVDAAGVLLAGWLAGAVVGLADSGLLLVLLSRHPGWAARLPAFRVRLSIIGIVVANGMVIGWTLIGLLMGLLALKVAMPAFVLLAVGLCLAAGGLHVFFRGLRRGDEAAAVWGTVLAAIAGFAGLLPWLAAHT
jgi:hypothetical protein